MLNKCPWLTIDIISSLFKLISIIFIKPNSTNRKLKKKETPLFTPTYLFMRKNSTNLLFLLHFS